MVELEFPWQRMPLASVLKELSNPLLQWEDWIERKHGKLPQAIGFEEQAHFILDDWFGDDVDGLLGVILKTEEEVATMKKLVAALLAVICAVGKSAPDRDYITHPLWTDVIATARDALDAFTRAEHGYPIKRQS